jgi:hypothetical protein
MGTPHLRHSGAMEPVAGAFAGSACYGVYALGGVPGLVW